MFTQFVRARVPAVRRPAARWAAALLIPGALLGAGTHAAGRLTMAPESRLWVEGTSTVRSYTCSATKVDGTVGFQGEPGASLEEVGRAVDAVEIEVPVAALDCRNGTMNEHMRKALKAADNPVIRYRMTSREIAPRADSSGLTAKLTGTLSMAGREREIEMTADAVQEANGRYRVTGSEELRMTEFGIKPPSLMLGTLKVHDKVVVRYEVVLTNPDVAAAATP
jgi:polyisoprenoid-binding protein YceI